MKRLISILLIGALASSTAPAAAQSDKTAAVERAQELFDAAMKLMSAGDFKPACPLLEQSEKLDPGMGTRFRLAECYEKVARYGSAWKLFNDVADAARLARIAEREQVAKYRADTIASKVPKLVVKVPPEVSVLLGLEVRYRGETIHRDRWAQPLPSDVGEQALEVKATGKKTWRKAVKFEWPAQWLNVDVPMLEDGQDEPPPGSPPPPQQQQQQDVGPYLGIHWTPRRIGAVAAGGVGVLGLTLGTIFGASAASQWGDAQDTCEGGDFTRCSPAGVTKAEDASTAATVSTVSFVIGLAGLGAGAYLWFTAPRDEPAPSRGWVIVPAVGPGVAAGVLRAKF